MKTFRTKIYEIQNEKMKPGGKVRFALLADLHGRELSGRDGTLYQAVCAGRPDAVLVLGDMLVSLETDSLKIAEELLLELSGRYPVYYVLGNHECRMRRSSEYGEDYLAYERRLTAAGICFLHNEHTSMKLGDTDFVFYGLELPDRFFRKPRSPRLSLSYLEDLIGIPGRDGISVLLAHNPKYGSTYFSWNPDLIFCGHYHGGVIRLGENRGLTSPQFLLFPPYCCGLFSRGGQNMIVSAGLGEHTVPLRIHNPRELIFADICGKESIHGDTGQAERI